MCSCNTIKWFVRYGIVTVIFIWTLSGLVPLLSFWVFEERSGKVVENIKSVLQQYGTFGDMFGAFNALINGLTL